MCVWGGSAMPQKRGGISESKKSPGGPHPSCARSVEPAGTPHPPVYLRVSAHVRRGCEAFVGVPLYPTAA